MTDLVCHDGHMNEQATPILRTDDAEAVADVDEHRERGRSAVILGVLITTSAIGLVALHVARPRLRIDGITVALILVAALPWLGSIFNAIQLPGGWRFEYQQFKQVVQKQLSDVSSRVERVEQYVFSGEVTDELKDKLGRALHEFHNYLQGLGIPLPQDEPQVHIESPVKSAGWLAYYESKANRIVISSQYADDPDLVEKQYAHQVLIGLADCESGKWQWDAEAIEAGLAVYFVCSFNNRPLLGQLTLSRLSTPVSSSNWAEDLRNQWKVSDMPSPAQPTLAGMAWGGALWEVREILGHEATDRLIIGAWRGLEVCRGASVAAEFTSRLLSSLESGTMRKVKSILRRRGIAS